MEIDPQVNSSDPAEHESGSNYKREPRPGTFGMSPLWIQIKPKGKAVCGERQQVEDDAMNILGVGQDSFALLFERYGRIYHSGLSGYSQLLH
jgi:hypothetical protein